MLHLLNKSLTEKSLRAVGRGRDLLRQEKTERECLVFTKNLLILNSPSLLPQATGVTHLLMF
jgi:hypothetical protein